jgi:hypothetical protein
MQRKQRRAKVLFFLPQKNFLSSLKLKLFLGFLVLAFFFCLPRQGGWGGIKGTFYAIFYFLTSCLLYFSHYVVLIAE